MKMANRLLSTTQIAGVVRDYIDTNDTMQTISDRYGVSRATANRIVKRQGLSGLRYPRLDSQTKEELLQAYSQTKEPMPEIAERFGVCVSTLVKLVQANPDTPRRYRRRA